MEVEDSAAKQKYMFPCNRWLSKSDDDKLICRELTCANIPSPGVKDKVSEYKDSPLEIMILHLIKYFLSCETYVTPVYRVQHTGHLFLVLEATSRTILLHLYVHIGLNNCVLLPAYEIEVVTSDKKDAGMIHNAWIILDGDIKSSKEFVMENSSKKQILRRYFFSLLF